MTQSACPETTSQIRFINSETAWQACPSINDTTCQNIWTHRASVAEIKWQKKPGSGRRILHSLLVSIQSSATLNADTRLLCVGARGGAEARTRERASWL